jgi:hypothetical protein
MTGWFGKRRISAPESDHGPFVVVVRTDTLADETRRALRVAGATQVV